MLTAVTATHLKRLFANQDVFNSLDRNVAGMTVTEADEKEVKSGEGESLPSTEAPAPRPESPPAPAESSGHTETSNTPSDGPTPLAGIYGPVRNPMSAPQSPMREYDSDSTISAHPQRDLPPPVKLLRPPMGDAVESSGMDSDAHGFVSRLPRRSRPTPR